MLKDITIGQYFPGVSIVHRADARTKILLSFSYVVMLMTTTNFKSIAVCSAYAVIAYFASRINLSLIVKSLKPILPLIVVTGFLNLFFIPGEELVFEWEFVKIYRESLNYSGYMIVRVITLIVGMSLLTYTSSPVQLTDAIESLLSPLKKLKAPVHELAMMMTIALRFVPTLIEETDRIMMAQKARGADFEVKGLKNKARALMPIMVPLFVSAFKRADELAVAMECRCYRGGEGRTRLKKSKISSADFVLVVFTVLTFAAVIFLNNKFKAVI